jgi:hypothetical protein
MGTANLEPVARAICEQELRSLPASVDEAALPAQVDRYWPVIAAEISAGLRDENGRLLPHSTEAGLAAWEAWLDEHSDQRKPIGR